ncbi:MULTISPECIES: hypothetical protein [Oscillatoriales]|uniref:Uncharacterized protein n=1 Tax=Aerosakkonema funiforme FACHB-1375 TaxID=2949571 RepID=A0A926VGQ9_9CYAN|nr:MULTISPECIES: hypothetical protein [Oscillatoriales]MBD2183375.1 hypothetical protein [Aerosakkonema funiforme FACHB-1375]
MFQVTDFTFRGGILYIRISFRISFDIEVIGTEPAPLFVADLQNVIDRCGFAKFTCFNRIVNIFILFPVFDNINRFAGVKVLLLANFLVVFFGILDFPFFLGLVDLLLILFAVVTFVKNVFHT